MLDGDNIFLNNMNVSYMVKKNIARKVAHTCEAILWTWSSADLELHILHYYYWHSRSLEIDMFICYPNYLIPNVHGLYEITSIGVNDSVIFIIYFFWLLVDFTCVEFRKTICVPNFIEIKPVVKKWKLKQNNQAGFKKYSYSISGMYRKKWSIYYWSSKYCFGFISIGK